MLTAWSVAGSRADAWDKARRGSENLVEVILGDVVTRLTLYDFVLDEIAGELADRDVPMSLTALRHQMRRSLGELGRTATLVVLDKSGGLVVGVGDVVADATDFADRDYFTAPRDGGGTGVYVGAPYVSRRRGDEPSITFSCRLEGADGSFQGVVAIGLRLAGVWGRLEALDVGPDGTVGLLRDDGVVLARAPRPHVLGEEVGQTATFRRMAGAERGSFIGTGFYDGVVRLYSFARVPGLPIIVVVGRATEEVLADWRQRTWIAGAVTGVICAAGIALAVVTRREGLRRAALEARLKRLSDTDGLAGLVNRRRFDELLDRAWRETVRRGTSLAVLMIDLDHFKRVNDGYGHARGDEVLRRLAQAVESCLRRPADVAARFGGEEFVVLLPDTDAAGAVDVAEAIRVATEAGTGRSETAEDIVVTASLGVAVAPPGDAPADLVARADAALYRAKAEGRNRVVVDG